MAYQALYRSYRPQDFKSVAGQRHVVTTLQNAIKLNKVAHAYLFSGPRGTGKTSMAKIMAKALNCVHGPTTEPCNECEICKGITKGTISDIVEIDAGDTYAYDEEGKKTQREREVKAADRIFGILPDDQRDNFRNLWEEFEKGETTEAKFAHTMDNFQPAMLNDLTEGKSWVEKGVHLSQILERNKNTAAGSKEIWDYAYKNIFEKNVEAGKIKKDN